MNRFLALDVGGSHIACAVVADDRVIARDAIDLGGDARLAVHLPRIEAALARLIAAAGPAEAMAIAFPALLDPHRQRVLSTPKDKFEDAVGFDFAGWARQRFGVPLRMELDARMALMGELRSGALKGATDAAMLTLGTGIGSAVVIDGTLLRGKHFAAGTLGGHLSRGIDGRACICGSVGCTEADASTWALPAVAAAHRDYADSALARAAPLDFAAVFSLAASGDAVAVAVRDACIDAWATAALNLVHAYDVEIVALGGGVMAAAATIVPRIQAHVARHCWTAWGTPTVVAGTLAGDAALIGAAQLWALP
ncbi:MAG: ROK family protein [Sphingomonadaceae bacterium]|nr:ROK family protein [Sphingomonadaceae bacterium]